MDLIQQNSDFHKPVNCHQIRPKLRQELSLGAYLTVKIKVKL